MKTAPKRVNKTVGNLKLIWSQLDDASGSLYNAVDSADRMVEMPKELKDLLDRLDISAVDSVKNLIEQLIVEKGGSIEDIAVEREVE